jgi:hypothetical protein
MPAGGSVTEVQMTGRAGIPSLTAAVSLNVTVSEAAADGFVTVYPCGTAIPNSSSLNYRTGSTIPNAVTTKVGATGRICLYTSAAAHLIVDINGFYPTGSSFSPMPPARLLDSRPGGATADGQFAAGGVRASGSVTELQIATRVGVPVTAAAVSLNVTVTEAAAPGFITVFPCGTPIPNSSNLNYLAGSTIPNAVLAKVGAGGRVCLFTNAGTHLIVDINGYFPG